jgi:peptidoglycan/xylan/chitin deacetylase (PgdA/CDA1 family)
LNLLHKPRVLRFVSRHLLCSVPTRERRVALTFDDGPHPRETPRLLRLLDARRVRATFFLLGRNVLRYPHLAAEIAARGHEIGNHTYNHVVLPLLPRRLMLRELERASHLIQSATGEWPRLFRPPMGWFSRSMMRTVAEHGYRGVLGDVYPQDTRRPGAEIIAQRVLERVRPGSIVILHDGVAFGPGDRSQSIEAVDLVIERLRDRHYEMEPVGSLVERAQAQASSAAAAPPRHGLDSDQLPSTNGPSLSCNDTRLEGGTTL